MHMNPAYLILLLSSLALLATLACDGWRHLRRALRDTRRDWRILRDSRTLVSAAVMAELMPAELMPDGPRFDPAHPDFFTRLSQELSECRRRVSLYGHAERLRLCSPLWLDNAQQHRRHADAARRRLINRALAALLGGTVLWLAARNLARPFAEWLLSSLFS